MRIRPQQGPRLHPAGPRRAGVPWVLDGVTEAEEAGLWGISGMSYTDQSLASEVIGSMSELLSLSGDLVVYALHAIGQIGEFS